MSRTSAKSRTDTRLSSAQKPASRVQEEIEGAREEKATQKARLRALRLAKEASDKAL